MRKELFEYICANYLSIPYLWAGDDPIKGYDCSGLMQELLAVLGLDPKGDQTAQTLHDFFNKPENKVDTIYDTGTLIFYGRFKYRITHVAMFIGNQTLIEAGGGGSKNLNREDAIKQNAYIRMRRWDHRKDPVAVITPKGLPWSVL
jgi:cell wall-associated NlpC family hydrolase